MAKRFIDTGIFDDEWFMELSKDGKLTWLFLLTNCDHAGVWKMNAKLFEFKTGIKSLGTVVQELGNRLVRVGQEYLFVPNFLKFQYPGFPNSKAPQQNGAVKILKERGLWEDSSNTLKELLPDSSGTVTKELANSIGNGNGEGNGKKGGVGENICEEFEKARKLYLGERRGYKTEFELFKKHKDYLEALPLLVPAIQKEKERKEALKNSNQFVPPWQHFKTWLNQRGWEKEQTTQENVIAR